MRVSFGPPGGDVDVELTIAERRLSIGEVYTSVIGHDPGPRVVVDGWPFWSSDPVEVVPIRNGSRLATGDGSTDPEVGTTGSATGRGVRLTCIAGLGSGQQVELGPGAYDVDGVAGPRADPTGPTETLFRLEVGHGDVGLRRIRPVGGRLLLVDGEPVPPEGVAAAEVIEVDQAVFRVSGPAVRRSLTPALTESGHVPVRRQPRMLSQPAAEPPPKPRRPAPPRDQSSFPWIMALAPIPIGLIAAFLFSPFFLVFMLMSPVLAAARWVDGKRRFRKATITYGEDLHRVLTTYADDIRVWRVAEGRRLRRATPDLGQLAARAAATSPELWERRPNHPDFLAVTLGYGDRQVPLGVSGDDVIDTVSEHLNRLHTIPIVADLASEPAVGIVGPGPLRRQVAAALLAELVVGHGPADLGIALLADRVGADDWDWAKWVPHLDGDRGRPQVATDLDEAVELLDDIVSRATGPESTDGHQTTDQGSSLATPATVVLVDGPQFLDGRFTALAKTLHRNAARAILLADDHQSLPATCSVVLSLDGLGRSSVRMMSTGQHHDDVRPVMLQPERAAEIVRELAPLADPDRAGPAADLPRTCDLRSLVAHGRAAGSEPSPLDAGLVAERWGSLQATLGAVIGVAGSGPLRIDLVDDGPHALIAGTTGSGKSELLRTLVASLAMGHSPERLTFLLIDFKGGGAFDACARLPHTVGVVTDLDEHLAGRALRCLRAELRYRERRLRDVGITDIAEHRGQGGPLPRLVVVVDEFATLAAELPDFMSSLIDVAQRGRSLGIHLILATQRPAGVVDAKIRANTNLRIALRVQDDGDSIDVVGDARAATIDRRTPGRGFVRLGAGELARFQTALVSTQLDQAPTTPISVTPFALAPSESWSGPLQTERTGPTDLELLVDASNEACQLLDLAPPRVPWPAPLQPGLDIIDLDTLRSDGHGQDEAGPDPRSFVAPLGLIDLPDQQETRVHTWTPEQGNLLVYGADQTVTGNVIRTLFLGLARQHRPDRFHGYVIDCSGSASLADLADLPQVGAAVDLREDERLIRVLDIVDGELTARSEAARQNASPTTSASTDTSGSAGATGSTDDTGRVRQPTNGDDRPLLVLAIANFGALVDFFEETNRYATTARIERLVRDGPAVGIHVVVSASHERSVPSRIAGLIESRLIMRMADPTAYLAFGFRSSDMVDLPAGRGLLTDGTEFQLATYGPALAAAIAADGGGVEGAAGPGPTTVEVLSADLPTEPFLDRSRTVRAGWDLVIGQRFQDLGPAAVELRPGTNVIVSGRSGSGKTTALRALAVAARRADPDCQMVVRTNDPDEWPSLGRGPNGSLEPLGLGSGEVATDGRVLLLVDGLASLGEELAEALERGVPDRLWVILADRPEVLQAAPLWVRRLAGSQTGLFLQPAPEHGELVRVRLPIREATDHPPGRGFLICAGRPELVQVVNATADELGGLDLSASAVQRRPNRAASTS